MTIYIIGLQALAAIVGLSLAAGAASDKVTMSQVIAADGEAAGLGIDDQDGAVNFEVTILKDNMRQKVFVDRQSGNVTKIVAAQDDEEHSDRIN